MRWHVRVGDRLMEVRPGACAHRCVRVHARAHVHFVCMCSGRNIIGYGHMAHGADMAIDMCTDMCIDMCIDM